MTLAMQMLLGTSEGETIGGLLPPPAEDGNAGISVSVSLSEVSLNRRLAIGAPGFEGGVVFIYEAPIGSANFSFLTTVPNASIQTDNEFGRAVALSDDGLRLIVGAPNEAVPDFTVGGGRVHTFSWNGSVYQKDGGPPLDSGDVFAGANARFGETLAIDKSGVTILVGAPKAQADIGYAYTYVATGDAPPLTQWVQLAGKLAGTFFAGNFAKSLDMGFGGLNAIAVGQGPLNPELSFFDRPDSASQFILRQTSQITGGAASCTLDDNGQLAFVGGRVGLFPNQLESYGQIGNLSWTFRAVLVGIPGGTPNYAFSMAASDDRLVVSDINGGGQVNIYSFQLNGNMAFMQTDFAPQGGESEAKFGFALKINNAPLYVAGEPDRDRSGFEDAGNVYVLPVPT